MDKLPRKKKQSEKNVNAAKEQEVDQLFDVVNELLESSHKKRNQAYMPVCRLVRLKAWEVKGCKKTELVKYIDRKGYCQDYVYSMLRSARIEEMLDFDEGSFTISHGIILGTLKVEEYILKAWDLACEEAGGQGKVEKAHIKNAVAIVDELRAQESSNEENTENSIEGSSGSKEVKDVNAKQVVSAYLDLKDKLNSKQKRFILSILKGDKDYRNICNDITSKAFTELDRKNLMALIKGDENKFED